MTKTLFIESRDGKNVTEVWSPSDAEMAELGWYRRHPDVSIGPDATDSLTTNPGDFELKGASNGPLKPGDVVAGRYVITESLGGDDDPEPTRYDVPDLETKTNGYHVAEAELSERPVELYEESLRRSVACNRTRALVDGECPCGPCEQMRKMAKDELAKLDPPRCEARSVGNRHGVQCSLILGHPEDHLFPNDKMLLTDRLAQLLPERIGKGEGAAMAHLALLTELLSKQLGKVF